MSSDVDTRDEAKTSSPQSRNVALHDGYPNGDWAFFETVVPGPSHHDQRCNNLATPQEAAFFHRQGSSSFSFVGHWELLSYRCPYCRAENGCRAYCMWAHRLCDADYSYLIKRGWCRSGQMLYLPLNAECCCKQYSMRIRVDRFIRSASQQRVVDKIRCFSRRGVFPAFDFQTIEFYAGRQSKRVADLDNKAESFDWIESPCPVLHCAGVPERYHSIVVPSTENVNGGSSDTADNVLAMEKALRRIVVDAIVALQWQKFVPLLDDNSSWILRRSRNGKFGAFSSSVPSVVIKAMEKTSEPGMAGVSENVISAFVNILTAQVTGGVALESDCIVSPVYIRAAGPSFINFEVPEQYHPKIRQLGVRTRFASRAPRTCSNSKTLVTKLQVLMEPAHFCEHFYNLFVRYQISIHGESVDKMSRQQFSEFLVDSPIMEPTSKGLGTFHRKYWLEDFEDGNYISRRLIGVGVLDILSTCVHSCYFVWDPAVKSLSLGVFSVLEEIEMTRSIQASVPSVEHYVIGFYAHGSAKMLYKTKYRPAELFDQERGEWCNYNDVIPELDAEAGRGPQREEFESASHEDSRDHFSAHRNTSASSLPRSIIMVLCKNQVMPLDSAMIQYPELFIPSVMASILQFFEAVGPAFASRVVYAISR